MCFEFSCRSVVFQSILVEECTVYCLYIFYMRECCFFFFNPTNLISWLHSSIANNGYPQFQSLLMFLRVNSLKKKCAIVFIFSHSYFKYYLRTCNIFHTMRSFIINKCNLLMTILML